MDLLAVRVVMEAVMTLLVSDEIRPGGNVDAR